MSRGFREGISVMQRRFGSTRLALAGFVVGHAEIGTDCVFLDVRVAAASATCPCCGTSSRRTQSRYLRQAADLPIAGRRVVLRVTVRRFWCDAVLCRRRIFAERFGAAVLAPLSRKTGRLETIVHHLGLALGGRPAAAFAERLMMPVSNDTLLCVVLRRTEQPRNRLSFIGIDDFAFRRGQRYGTIVCDLERRKPVTLLPDREQATSQAWLANILRS
ncbi:transposase family protein [Mesorhizobium newzealandense]|uniref:Transposase family protein n=1 Tax=Mesorhizobium newzealandense TaxID=1300302 RepID=A0ABW4UEB5_9HYPH